MGINKTSRLDDIIAALGAHLDVVHSHGLTCSALLIGIAQLDLKMRVHNISAHELKDFCKFLEQRIGGGPPPPVHGWGEPLPNADVTRAVRSVSVRRARAGMRIPRPHTIQ